MTVPHASSKSVTFCSVATYPQLSLRANQKGGIPPPPCSYRPGLGSNGLGEGGNHSWLFPDIAAPLSLGSPLARAASHSGPVIAFLIPVGTPSSALSPPRKYSNIHRTRRGPGAFCYPCVDLTSSSILRSALRTNEVQNSKPASQGGFDIHLQPGAPLQECPLLDQRGQAG